MPVLYSTSIQKEDGNVLIIILLAVALIGALTAAIQGSQQKNSNIDKETLILNVTQVQNYATELENGISYIMQNGISESDFRFSHPDANSDYGNLITDTDKRDQMFHRDGGNAQYRTPPKAINDGSSWEFYGNTALPQAGSDAAELIAVLPNVTSDFCDTANEMIGISGRPKDSSTCINTGSSARFSDSAQFSSSPNTTTEASFTIKPATRGCIECISDGSLHYFHVLIAR
jgi:hypothetical protein